MKYWLEIVYSAFLIVVMIASAVGVCYFGYKLFVAVYELIE